MGPELKSLRLLLLDGRTHRREEFFCDEPALDEYLKRHASQDATRGSARPYVLVDGSAPQNIIGFVTLSTLSVILEGLPATFQKRLPRYPEAPALLIGRLAVAQPHHGLGLGKELLRHALELCLEASEIAAAALVVVDALHPRATDFYEKYGFMPFDDEPVYPKRLFLPMHTVRQVLT